MTKYIRDKGRMRMCTSNIAKMNIFEYMYYYRYQMWDNIVSSVQEFFECWYIFVNILIILLLPLAYPIMAWTHIRKEKKLMKEMNKIKAESVYIKR